ncbi:porin [Aestuariivirga sp. YIM B02566]|uniref:Porin n=1 Tax=Taklimakanibacter albus TaxID=2800327 RepID=A0ACC5R6C2_9HYPH|nr:porin [Aestuariivirga sp. YIM B02566]MBK1868194.1 porin [Aestuariivirga sp. YIM B02566]
MKTMKWALLGGAAVAVTATAARADDLSALKAQIETLQSRVTQLEAQPQASMPSGYSLLSIRDGQGNFGTLVPERSADRVRDESGFTLSVVPTADAAPAAEVSVSGEIRTALLYSDFRNDDNADINIRGRIFIKGKADTAVGEVGGYFRLQSNGGGDFGDYSENVKMNKAYGWWKFAPEWELMAGYNDNTAVLLTSWDWLAATGPTRTFGPSNPYNEQIRLTYSSGPLSFALALEDPDNAEYLRNGEVINGDTGDIPAVQSYLMYSTDSFTAQIVGLYQKDDAGDNDDWAIGGGAAVNITEGIQLLGAAVFGEGTSSYAANLSPLTTDEQFWAGSAGILANLSDDTRLELGVGYEDYDDAGKALGFGGGVYWDPVSQVTLGVGATYIDFKDAAVIDNDGLDVIGNEDSLEVFFGTWLRFP